MIHFKVQNNPDVLVDVRPVATKEYKPYSLILIVHVRTNSPFVEAPFVDNKVVTCGPV